MDIYATLYLMFHSNISDPPNIAFQWLGLLLHDWGLPCTGRAYRPDTISKAVSDFPHFLQTKSGVVFSVRPITLPSAFYPMFYLLSFCAMQSNMLKTLLNKL
jgi:hypothetical protein